MNFRKKIVAWDALPEWRAAMRASRKCLVVTNGCFDILHLGHVTYLETARNQGDALLVGLNGDESVRQLKGPDRPVTPEDDRAAVLGALESVDGVCIFAERTATRFLAAAQPDVYVKGGDYTLDTLNQDERQAVEQGGGRIVIIPFVPGRSTTELLKKIKELCRAMTSPERGAGLGRPKTLYRNSVGTLESHPGKAGHPRKQVLRRRPRRRHEA